MGQAVRGAQKAGGEEGWKLRLEGEPGKGWLEKGENDAGGADENEREDHQRKGGR